MGFIFRVFVCSIYIYQRALPKVENLQPVLEAGWKPVIQAAFPKIVSFPFGETIVFAIFLPYLNDKKQGMIAGFSAIVFSGILLAFITTIMISVLGPFLASKSTFPLLQSAGKVNVGEVFQRIDPIALILLIIGGFFKITVFFCGAVEGFSSLVKKPNLTKYTIPVMAIAVIVMAIFMAENYVEHIKIGLEIAPNILYIPLFMVIPFLLVVIVMLKKKITKKKQL